MFSRKKKKYDDAEKLYLDALKIEQPSAQDPGVVLWLPQIAEFYFDRKNFVKAKPFYECLVDAASSSKDPIFRKDLDKFSNRLKFINSILPTKKLDE